MKKTLIISLEYPPQIGGIATYVHNLANALDPQKTIVLAPPHKDQKEWDAAQKYKIIRRQFLLPKFFWPRWLLLLSVVKKIVKEEGIEMIFVQHVLPVGYAAMLMKKKLKIPFLLFSHGTDLVAGTATKWKKKMVVKISQESDQILFNSESLKGRFLQVMPEFANTSTVLYPCPEPDLAIPPPAEEIEALRARYALQGKQVMLSISRLAEGKGFPHLIRMMPKILEQAPHLVWIIVGEGEKRDQIIKEIQARNLQNVTRFIGEIPHKDLKKFYYLVDLFVLITHPDEGMEEGLGLVFLEAAACGLPVVAGKSGGVEEAVIHTDTGLVVDLYKGDPEVIEAITTILKNKEFAARLGKRAKERIRADFQWEHQVKVLDRWII